MFVKNRQFLPYRMSVFIKAISMCFVKYTVSQKNIPDIFDCNFKKSYQILIISNANISDTARHQITIYLSTSPSVCFCTTKGMQTKQNMH